MSDYPKVKYLRSLETVLVHSKEEEDALVGEWGDGPMDFGIITAPAAGQAIYDPTLDKFRTPEPATPAAPVAPVQPQEPSEPVAVSTSTPEPPAEPEAPVAPAQE